MRQTKAVYWLIVSLLGFFLTMNSVGCRDDGSDPECRRQADCEENEICVKQKCEQRGDSSSESDTVADTTSSTDTVTGTDSASDTGTAPGTDSLTDTESAVCIPTQRVGEQCASDCDCFTSHCNNGSCCRSGTCCQTNADCDAPCIAGAVCDAVDFSCDFSDSSVFLACGQQSDGCTENERCDGFGSCIGITACPEDMPTVDSFRCFEGVVNAECGCVDNRDCDDNDVFCDGVMRCDGGVCYYDTPVMPCFANPCNTQQCDNVERVCIDGDDPCASESAQCDPRMCVVDGDGEGYQCGEDPAYRNGLPCDDGDQCNGTMDRCTDRQCVSGPAAAAPCFDGDPCTHDSCTPVVGSATETSCEYDFLSAGDSCSPEFECYGADATCEENPSGNLECIPKENICDVEGLGICRRYTCDDDPFRGEELYECSYEANLGFKTINCDETLELTASDFVTRSIFSYGAVCDSAGETFIGKEALVYLGRNPDEDIVASVSVVSVTPASFGGIELLMLQDSCTADSCVEASSDTISDVIITTTQGLPPIVIDSTQELWPPESVILRMTCAPVDP